MYPGAVAEFFFNQSSAHGAFVADALNAKEMNVNPGGQQRHMHSTIIPHDNPDPNLRGQVQDMVFPTDLPSTHPHYAFCGKPKGMRVVLQEQNIWDTLKALNGGKDIVGECSSCKLSQKARDALACGSAAQSIFDDAEDEDSPPDDAISPLRSKTCCMRMVLSHQADFLAEKPRLQTVIEAAGHKCYFLPNFTVSLIPLKCTGDGSKSVSIWCILHCLSRLFQF